MPRKPKPEKTPDPSSLFSGADTEPTPAETEAPPAETDGIGPTPDRPTHMEAGPVSETKKAPVEKSRYVVGKASITSKRGCLKPGAPCKPEYFTEPQFAAALERGFVIDTEK